MQFPECECCKDVSLLQQVIKLQKETLDKIAGVVKDMDQNLFGDAYLERAMLCLVGVESIKGFLDDGNYKVDCLMKEERDAQFESLGLLPYQLTDVQ